VFQKVETALVANSTGGALYNLTHAACMASNGSVEGLY
jgi:hypothetical protein